MTYIKLTDDMRLEVTQADTIYRGDNLSKEITFLLPSKAGNVEIDTATIFLTYIRADGTPDIVVLEKESVMYNADYYRYTLPVTCKLSRYPGEICVWLQIYSGSGSNPVVSKTGECVIRIHNSKNIDCCLDDHQITALYQMKKQIEGMSGGCDPDCGDEWTDMTEDVSTDEDDGDSWSDM